MTTYRTPVDPVVIVGAGPAGLATAYALQRRGVTARVLEKNDRAGASWETYYDALRLNSGRVVSSLPGMRIDRRYGRWVGRDDFIAYLRRYAASLAAPIEFGVSVDRIDRDAHCWSIQTSNGPLRARAVVVATGLNAVSDARVGYRRFGRLCAALASLPQLPAVSRTCGAGGRRRRQRSRHRP